MIKLALILLKKILVGYDKDHCVELEGAESIEFGESDPWIIIPLTKVFQEINPIIVEGTLTCFDAASLVTVFYKTDVQKAASKQ